MFEKYKKIVGWNVLLLGVVTLSGCSQQQTAQIPQQNQQPQTQVQVPSQETGTNQPVSVEASTVILKFKETFFNADYELQQLATGKDTLTSYFKHGVFVRMGDEIAKTHFIYKSGKVFVITPAAKTFKEFDVLKAPWDKLSGDSFTLIVPLARDTTDGKVLWNKESENMYVTKGEWNMQSDDGSVTPVDVRVSVNPQTKLIDTVYLRDNKNGGTWEQLDFKYRVVNNIDDLMRFPLDYTKAN